MLNQEDFKKPICLEWKHLSHEFTHNFFDSGTNEIGTKTFNELADYIIKICKNNRIVVTGGHLIPNPRNYDDVGRGPAETWDLACQLVKILQNNNIDSKLSLTLNDIDLKVDSREIIFNKFLRLPRPFMEIAQKNRLDSNKDLIHCSFNGDKIFSEKKLSNRTRYLVRRKKILDKKFEGKNYCHSALISYFIDLVEQNIDASIIIFPICSWINTKQSIDIFNELNASFRHVCYFKTSNCFL